MRDSGEWPPKLVGFVAYHGQDPLYHRVQSLDEGGQPTGLASCGANLIHIGPWRIRRPYEQPCGKCWPRKGATPPKPARRIAIVRTPLAAPIAPVGPSSVRVTPEGHLAIRDASGDPLRPWLILDMANPLLIEAASDKAAEGWRNLREAWDTEALVNSVELADLHEVDRSAISLWRRDPEFPRVAFTIGDRPGWYREQLPAIAQWLKNRAGQTGRPPNDPT